MLLFISAPVFQLYSCVQTTLSGDGRDLSLSYQGFVVLDDVRFVNGNQLGKRAIFQVRSVYESEVCLG